jgi:hypothetical protein
VLQFVTVSLSEMKNLDKGCILLRIWRCRAGYCAPDASRQCIGLFVKSPNVFLYILTTTLFLNSSKSIPTETGVISQKIIPHPYRCENRKTCKKTYFPEGEWRGRTSQGSRRRWRHRVEVTSQKSLTSIKDHKKKISRKTMTPKELFFTHNV